MRVAIVCPTYVAGLSYQENVWAEQLVRKGHTVAVIAASSRSRAAGLTEAVAVGESHYNVHYARTKRLPHGVYLSRGVGELIAGARPDVVLMMGDKQFGQDVWKRRDLGAIPVASFFSENLGHHEYDWRKKGISLKQRGVALAFQLLRGRSLRRCCERSTILVGNTPQAGDVLLPLFRAEKNRREIEAKLMYAPLGFSAEHFQYSPEVRDAARQRLGVSPTEILVCAPSRMQPDKLPILLPIVQALQRVMPDCPAIRPLIVGFEENAVSSQLEKAIASNPLADRFIRHPFAGRKALNDLFNASDIAIFGRASIACQEALATGLQACFDNAGALNHLVTREDQAVFYSRLDASELAQRLITLITKVQNQSAEELRERRRARAEAAQWLRYDRIVHSVMAELYKRNALPCEAAIQAG